MFDARYAAFATLSALLVLSPGATLAVVIETALGHGRRAALLTVVGIGLANATLAASTAFGLSALVDRWPSALPDRPPYRRRLPRVSRRPRPVACLLPSAAGVQHRIGDSPRRRFCHFGDSPPRGDE